MSTVGNHDAWLDPGETLTCSATYTVTQSDVTAGKVTNIATATADETQSNQDTVTVSMSTPSPPSKLGSQTTTDIHDAQHQVVTTVAAGATVHDLVTVRRAVRVARPERSVTIDWFTNGDCSGTPAANSGNVTLDANGLADSTAFARGPLGAGTYAFRAHYLGDATYNPSDGPCEPLRVVDANIQIGPSADESGREAAHVHGARERQQRLAAS